MPTEHLRDRGIRREGQLGPLAQVDDPPLLVLLQDVQIGQLHFTIANCFKIVWKTLANLSTVPRSNRLTA